MPIITFDDEKLLAKIEVEVAKAFNGLTDRVRQTARAEKKLGSRDIYHELSGKSSWHKICD